MDATTENYLRSKTESNRKRLNPDFRYASSRKREHKRLPNVETEQNGTSSGSHTALHDLPLEILDIILQKSYLHWILNSPTKQRDVDVIRSLTSVDVCFYRTIIRKRFKRSIWRFLKDFYRKTKKRSAVIRNNRDYLLENILPSDELIASLLYHKCITQEQSRFIQRQNSTLYKNSGLLFVAMHCDDAKFSNFVKSLRQTKQKTVTRIIENGGGATKIELQSHGAKCTASMESLLLHQKIEDLRKGAKSWSHQTYKLISHLKEEGLEILNSQLDRQTVVVWIWCRSQAALANIQKRYESNQLRDVFFEKFQHPPSSIINIDRNQFKKTIVVCPFSISFTQRIKIQEYEDVLVHGVTKLRNDICILFASLCRHSSLRFPVIHVFEGQNPFNWQNKIELTWFEILDDIGSNERENCLYVTQYFGNSVWKITKEGDDRHRIVEWLTIDYLRPNSLSVSTDGQFLALNDFSLMIYGSDAKLVRSIQLPTDIMYPLHAVQTSIGNFIILSEWNERELVTKWWGINELTRDGQMVVRRFIPSNEMQQLNDPEYFILDSDDRVFVADSGNDRVILLDSDLKWNRLLIPTGEKEETRIIRPNRLCYDEEMKQLIVAGNIINVYSLSRK